MYTCGQGGGADGQPVRSAQGVHTSQRRGSGYTCQLSGAAPGRLGPLGLAWVCDDWLSSESGRAAPPAVLPQQTGGPPSDAGPTTSRPALRLPEVTMATGRAGERVSEAEAALQLTVSRAGWPSSDTCP